MLKCHLNRYFYFCLMVLCTPPVQALDTTRLQNFSFSLTQFTHTLQFDSQLLTHEVQLMQIAWDEKIATYLDGGLRLGYSDELVTNHPTTELSTASGQFLGINFRIPLKLTERTQLYLGLDYTTANLRSISSENHQREWQELGLSAGWHWRRRDIGLHLSTHQYELTGRDTADATILTFSGASNSYTRAQLNIYVRNGMIALRQDYGDRKGGSLIFQHAY